MFPNFFLWPSSSRMEKRDDSNREPGSEVREETGPTAEKLPRREPEVEPSPDLDIIKRWRDVVRDSNRKVAMLQDFAFQTAAKSLASRSKLVPSNAPEHKDGRAVKVQKVFWNKKMQRKRKGPPLQLRRQLRQTEGRLRAVENLYQTEVQLRKAMELKYHLEGKQRRDLEFRCFYLSSALQQQQQSFHFGGQASGQFQFLAPPDMWSSPMDRMRQLQMVSAEKSQQIARLEAQLRDLEERNSASERKASLEVQRREVLAGELERVQTALRAKTNEMQELASDGGVLDQLRRENVGLKSSNEEQAERIGQLEAELAAVRERFRKTMIEIHRGPKIKTEPVDFNPTIKLETV